MSIPQTFFDVPNWQKYRYPYLRSYPVYPVKYPFDAYVIPVDDVDNDEDIIPENIPEQPIPEPPQKSPKMLWLAILIIIILIVILFVRN